VSPKSKGVELGEFLRTKRGREKKKRRRQRQLGGGKEGPKKRGSLGRKLLLPVFGGNHGKRGLPGVLIEGIDNLRLMLVKEAWAAKGRPCWNGVQNFLISPILTPWTRIP